jgi:deoxyribodipyrimidine photo-lyase
MPALAIHWFRRDLRLRDNSALAEAQRRHGAVLPVFILDDALLARSDMGAPRVAFLLESLAELGRALERLESRLIVRRGSPVRELPALLRATGAAAVTVNRDYSPYARRRDRRVRAAVEAAGGRWIECSDQLLVEPEACVKDDGRPYTVFTPFARRWRAIEKRLPERRPPLRGPSREVLARAGGIALPDASALGFAPAAEIERGGESAAHRRLDRFAAGPLLSYARDRDFPEKPATSRLSAHLKFGTISVRTVSARARGILGEELANLDPARPHRDLSRAETERLRQAGVFLNELCWRDFYQAILFHFPRVANGPFQSRFADFRWPEADPALIEAWREGRTGVPLVDAGMRQLAATGWMHNRLRMVVAMFLAKTMLVDWRIGERIFMQRLVDGDLAANNGGWQWCASTGTDAAPYFRIFNPTSQAKKFDPEGAFIRRWVPELRSAPARLVHEPWRDSWLGSDAYPRPCVDLVASRALALDLLAPHARGG